MKFSSLRLYNTTNNQSTKHINDNSPAKKKHFNKTVMATSAIGTSIALGFICHKQGLTLSKLSNVNFKDWLLFKNKANPLLRFEEKEILTLASGSVVGGLIGGALTDKKENFMAKLYESLTQILGNVAIPVGCVGGLSRLYKKYEKNLMNRIPQFKENVGTKKIVNRVLKAMPPVATTMGALAVGIIAGNKTSNFLNGKISGEKQNRKIRLTDFAPHVDDLGIAVTFIAPGMAVSTMIARTIPFFLTVPGYETGIAKKVKKELSFMQV